MSYATAGVFSPIVTTCQAVEYDTSTATLTACTRECVVEVTTTTACHMKIGATPTAEAPVPGVTPGDIYLAAGIPRQFRIHPGMSVAFVKATGGSAGTAFVTLVNT